MSDDKQPDASTNMNYLPPLCPFCKRSLAETIMPGGARCPNCKKYWDITQTNAVDEV